MKCVTIIACFDAKLTHKSHDRPGYRSWFHFSIEHDIAHELRNFVKMAASATATHARDSKHQRNHRRTKPQQAVKLMWRYKWIQTDMLALKLTSVYIPYTSSVIDRIYNGSVIQYWRSCTPSRSIGECAVPDLNAILCFLWFTNCVLLFDNNLILGCLWHCVFV